MHDPHVVVTHLDAITELLDDVIISVSIWQRFVDLERNAYLNRLKEIKNAMEAKQRSVAALTNSFDPAKQSSNPLYHKQNKANLHKKTINYLDFYHSMLLGHCYYVDHVRSLKKNFIVI